MPEATSPQPVRARAWLAVAHGAALVLEGDNRPPRTAAALQAVLRAGAGALRPFAPPHRPRYNGLIEAGRRLENA